MYVCVSVCRGGREKEGKKWREKQAKKKKKRNGRLCEKAHGNPPLSTGNTDSNVNLPSRQP